jgi:hypothetical protein
VHIRIAGSVIFVPACGIRPNAADGRHKSGETVEQAGLAAAGRRGTVRLNELIHLPRLEQVSQVSRSREQPQCQFMRNCTELGYPPDGLEISRILDEGFFCASASSTPARSPLRRPRPLPLERQLRPRRQPCIIAIVRAFKRYPLRHGEALVRCSKG